ANSVSLQPTPIPAMTRPPDSASSDAISLATTTALRCGTTITEVPSRTVGYRAPTQASVPRTSKYVRYSDAPSLESTRTWSVVQTESQPSRSAVAAAASIASGEARAVQLGR